MGRAKALCPSYSLHKSTNPARVRVEGRDIYLGPYNSPESRQRYAEILAQLTAGKAVSVPAVSRGAAAADPGVTVNELVAAFLQHADGHYVKDGKQTSEVHCLKSAVRPLVEMFGFTPADDFGPLKLSAVREQMVAAGWCRRGVNQGVKRIRIVLHNKHKPLEMQNPSSRPSPLEQIASLLFWQPCHINTQLLILTHQFGKKRRTLPHGRTPQPRSRHTQSQNFAPSVQKFNAPVPLYVGQKPRVVSPRHIVPCNFCRRFADVSQIIGRTHGWSIRLWQQRHFQSPKYRST